MHEYEIKNLHGDVIAKADTDRGYVDLSNMNLRDADMSGMVLEGVHLYGSDLSGARLDGADFYWADLSSSILDGASCRGTQFRGADLSGCSMRNVDLTDASFARDNVGGSTNLCDTDMRGSMINRTDFAGVLTNDRTVFPAGPAL